MIPSPVRFPVLSLSLLLLLSLLVGTATITAKAATPTTPTATAPRTAAPMASTTAAPATTATATQTVERRPALTVFAAASLREVFLDLGRRFEATHSGRKVEFSFAGSQELRRQIEEGAPADLFASADGKQMDLLIKAGLASSPRIFARNELVVIVPHGNPARVGTLGQLPNAVRLVIAAPEVPAGNYFLEVLRRADAARAFGADFKQRVLARVVSRELNVRQVLTKVMLGEADAGVVYRTDVAAANANTVEIVAIPPELSVVVEYPVAAVTTAGHTRGAREAATTFIDFLMSETGRGRLRVAGFLPPPPPVSMLAPTSATDRRR